jgi:hypothetical protein
MEKSLQLYETLSQLEKQAEDFESAVIYKKSIQQLKQRDTQVYHCENVFDLEQNIQKLSKNQFWPLNYTEKVYTDYLRKLSPVQLSLLRYIPKDTTVNSKKAIVARLENLDLTKGLILHDQPFFEFTDHLGLRITIHPSNMNQSNYIVKNYEADASKKYVLYSQVSSTQAQISSWRSTQHVKVYVHSSFHSLLKKVITFLRTQPLPHERAYNLYLTVLEMRPHACILSLQ